ncbi:MAG: Crp/Fnr family transcriptional regulator [Bdellovibrionales bacterium]|nr:Crp/Fnr family transcriptional regulator [Bdellovibrionales bacterium]
MINISIEKHLGKYISKEWMLILKTYATHQSLKKNERILNEGAKVDAVYFINTGKVKIVSHFDKVNERLLRLSASGDLVGHRAISSSTYPISAIALTDTEVIRIPIEIFQNLIRANPDFAIYVIDFLANDLKSTEERMKSMIHSEVTVRIAMIICMLVDAFGYDKEDSKKLNYTLPRADMASFAGTTYESVIRSLAKLEEMKIIQLDNKSLYLLKEKELRKLITKNLF